MTVTSDEALSQLNSLDGVDDPVELELYVDAANEWVATRVTDTTPAPVRLATLMLVDHLWETQRGPVSSAPFDDSSFDRTGYAVPNRVLELLAPYLTDGLGQSPAAPRHSFPDAVAYPDPVEWPR